MGRCQACEILKEEIRYLRAVVDRLHERMGVEPTDQPVRHSIDSHPPRLLETEETKTVSIPFGDD